MMDACSSRGPTSLNHHGPPRDETAFLDAAHMPWFTRSLLDARAAWKLMSSAIPLCHELELAALPHVMKTRDIAHAVWSTAGIHDTAGYVDDLATAQFIGGHPLRAVVAAPFHDGSSGLNTLETPCLVGPQVLCHSIPEGARPKAPRPLTCHDWRG
jgi:alkaline phosphatase D